MPVLVSQLEVYYMLDRLLTVLTTQQICNSFLMGLNKTILVWLLIVLIWLMFDTGSNPSAVWFSVIHPKKFRDLLCFT